MSVWLHAGRNEVNLEPPGVPRVLCPARRLGPCWCLLLLHCPVLASPCLLGLSRCKTGLTLHYTQPSSSCFAVLCHRLPSRCGCCSLAAARCGPDHCRSLNHWDNCSWPCLGLSCSGSPGCALHSCPASIGLCCCGSDTTRLSSGPGADSGLGCAHQPSGCSIAASAPHCLHTAGLYSRAVSTCPDRARGGLGAASCPVGAGCGEPPAGWSHVHREARVETRAAAKGGAPDWPVSNAVGDA